jgi:hypothetical protein
MTQSVAGSGFARIGVGPQSEDLLETPDGSLRISPTGARRRPAMAIVSVVIIATCSAVFGVINVRSSHLVSVIGVAQQVPQGQDLTAGNLRKVEIGALTGIATIPASEADTVVGKPAAVTLLAGTLLSPADVNPVSTVPAGQAIVGVDLKPGMVPATGVQPGESVSIVLTAPAGSSISGQSSGPQSQSDAGQASGSSPVLIGAGVVVAVNDSPDDATQGDVVASIQLAAVLAPIVADASATGQAALVEIGGST